MLVLIAIVVVLMAAGMWYQYTTSQDVIQRLESQAKSSADQARSAEQKAQQALDSLKRQQGSLAALRAEVQESKAELQSLGTAFQTITDRGSDLVLLNDIDHLVMIAQQQLLLSGNVANAIISLETAQAQLARANRPALSSLQQTINGDLDRLRAATTVDIALLSSRLDELAGLLAQAPLLVPDDAVPELEESPDGGVSNNGSSVEPAPDVEGEWWEKALARTQRWTAQTFETLRHDLGQLISVRRVDDAAALLISPDQASRFRDSLRQRIMTAQLALMMDQSSIWEAETDSLLKAIESRFDPRSAVTRQAIRIAREVADTAIDSALPDVTNTIQALEALNEQMGRGPMPAQPTTENERDTAESAQQTNKAPEASEPAQSADDSAQSTKANDEVTSDDGTAAQSSDNVDNNSGDVDATDGATSEQTNQNTGNSGLKL